jgi:hypothetical protein
MTWVVNGPFGGMIGAATNDYYEGSFFNGTYDETFWLAWYLNATYVETYYDEELGEYVHVYTPGWLFYYGPGVGSEDATNPAGTYDDVYQQNYRMIVSLTPFP